MYQQRLDQELDLPGTSGSSHRHPSFRSSRLVVYARVQVERILHTKLSLVKFRPLVRCDLQSWLDANCLFQAVDPMDKNVRVRAGHYYYDELPSPVPQQRSFQCNLALETNDPL